MIGAGLRRAAALSTAVALVLSGCLADAPVPTADPTPTPEPDATPIVTRYPLNTIIWYGGLVLSFGTATTTLDAKGGPVSVEVTFTNPGEIEATLEGPIRLTTVDTVVEPGRETSLPSVPAAGTAEATVMFEIDGTFDILAAAIRVGRDSEHQAIVPLVAGPETPPVTLEPLEAEVAVDGQAGSIFVDLYHLELRADLPDWGLELPRDVLALTLSYDATFRSDFPGGAAFTTENVRLTLPGGETVGPRPDGHSHSIALLRPNRRNTISTRFEVPVPGSGTYTFVVGDGSATVDLPFVIQVP